MLKIGFVTLLTFTSLSGQEVALFNKKEKQEQAKKANEIRPGYNASCRICLERGYDFFASASFTYWQAIQENMKLGVVSDTSNPEDLVNGDEVDLDFDFKPGFKVGLGMNFDYDNWDTFLQYTWYRGTDRVKKNLDPDNVDIALLPAWQIPDFLNPKYNYGSEKWRLNLNLIDWDLGRNCRVGTKLCARPFLGLRAAIINQRVRVNYTSSNPSFLLIWPSTFITQTSKSWGIGPRMGLSTDWKIWRELRLYGLGEFDLLFTQYDLKSKQTSDTPFANRFIINQNNANYLRAHLELDLGLGWGMYFADRKYHLDLSADYGFQVFFDQNMFRSTVSSTALGKSFLPNGNLYIQGLTITARFDF